MGRVHLAVAMPPARAIHLLAWCLLRVFTATSTEKLLNLLVSFAGALLETSMPALSSLGLP